MTHALSWLLRITLATAVGAGCLLLNDNDTLNQSGSLLSEAHARIERPLAPLSYAGVARRTTRRAVAVGAAASTVYAPGGYQAVDAYGRIYWRCP
jgi:hypothetical protein